MKPCDIDSTRRRSKVKDIADIPFDGASRMITVVHSDCPAQGRPSWRGVSGEGVSPNRSRACRSFSRPIIGCAARLVRVRSCARRMISSAPNRCLDRWLRVGVCWVPPAGLEPASQRRWILSPLRLPIPPRGRLLTGTARQSLARLQLLHASMRHADMPL